MGATLFKEFKVYKIDAGIPGDGHFGNSETVVVASCHCEKNCYPHIYKWSFEFIGSLNSFQKNYLPKTAYFFDDGLSQSPILENGNAFLIHLNGLHAKAEELTVSELHNIGWMGYSWSDDAILELDSVDHLKKYTYWLGTRYAARIDTQDDVNVMVREAYCVVPPGSEHPWIGCLWGLDATQISKIQSAPIDTDFRMAI